MLLMFSGAGQASGIVIMDGFGDADRNNNGAITPYDTDVDLSGAIDGAEISTAENAGDTGFIWVASRGFTSSNTGDPKANIKVIDDSTGDVDSAGLMSGYALGYEAKGSGSSIAGFFGQNVAIPAVGDEITAKFDIRIWTQSNNPTAAPLAGELRWGVFQDTDSQFGMTANEGLDSGAGQAPVVWGPDTGENDGEWFDSNPGPVGDAGIWARIPIGAVADPASARINYEVNTARFLEGTSPPAGDVDHVAGPPSDGPGGSVTNAVEKHQLALSILNTGSTVLVKAFIDGSVILSDTVGPADLGAPPLSYDYIALRNTGTFGDFDMVIDNVMISTRNVPEPASLVLLGLGGLMVLRRQR
jgi:hypothetical protein